MWSLLGCCLFGFFLATGTCLECESCFDAGHNCTGDKEICADGKDTCIISLKQLYHYPMTATFFSKECGPSSECNLGIRELDFGNRVGMRINRTCCTGDACETTSAPVLSPPEIHPNGFECPGCLGLFSLNCNPDPVVCTGSSTHCIELAGKISLAETGSMDMAMKGCASDAICNNLKANLQGFGGASMNLSMVKCTPASRLD